MSVQHSVAAAPRRLACTPSLPWNTGWMCEVLLPRGQGWNTERDAKLSVNMIVRTRTGCRPAQFPPTPFRQARSHGAAYAPTLAARKCSMI